MLPWLQSTFNFPLSGDVQQRIEPDWFFDTIPPETGDGEIEKEVWRKVASYGKQIGLLTEALLSLAEELPINDEKIDSLPELRELRKKIEELKASRKDSYRENARKSMERLRKHDREGFDSLLQQYQHQEGRQD